ncbi:Zn-ribbon domain-containing OB-fold protein [Thermoproteus tenax]|uniref:Predicted nucleic-acid-binding protein containing a Zn-ribbon n=1 Tax=Thermoproteus tenax (strain ATCC 35583 / DSM 2078 / JCM 9277 / NBRC 100435 / Kra 1) TaxID=768679 RepID=G4RJK9_THETK|nr:Zn-ribbon domain-containing OB-fold protein [Thermoproteus tenax]CCC81754.1 Predicted nucleic-acid-binding protein containing a Zn-ribbon [Thermoproteus tenax Kra 1]
MTSLLFRGLAEGKLLGSVCPSCGARAFPPKRLCPKCYREMEIVEIPKRGYVLTYSEVYVSNGLYDPPYTVAIADFGGFRVPGLVDGRVEIGDAVEWSVAETKAGLWYKFKRAGDNP